VSRPAAEQTSGGAMRAEIANLADPIRQGLLLLRRHL
jgi:hypothetical protein